jgi:hypothetical protein
MGGGEKKMLFEGDHARSEKGGERGGEGSSHTHFLFSVRRGKKQKKNKEN